jgi:hypothetical protein
MRLSGFQLGDPTPIGEHDQHVIEMNEVRRCASEWVQRGARKVAPKIDEPGHPTGHPAIP